MGNALQKNPQFDNQADDTSEHDTDLLLQCVSFKCRRTKKSDDADESALRKQASLMRIQKENEERERKFREAAEKRSLEEQARRQKEEKEAEQKRREALEAAERRKREKKAKKEKNEANEKPYCGIFDIFKTRQKTPEELRAEEANRMAKKEAQRLKEEEKERKRAEKERAAAQKAKEKEERKERKLAEERAEKERAAAQKARENEERKAKESAEKRESLGDYVCCPPFNRLVDSLADEEHPGRDKKSKKTAEELAAQERKQKEDEEAERQKAMEKKLAHLEKENAKNLLQEQEKEKKAQEKADKERLHQELLEREAKQKEMEEAERHRIKLAEKEQREQEMKDAETRRALEKEKKRLEKERAQKLVPRDNSDLDLKWCGNFCGKPQSKASSTSDDEKKKEPSPIVPVIKAEPVPVIKAEPIPEPVPVIKTEPVPAPVPCPPCPQPPIIQALAQSVQTEPIYCQAKVEKIDTTTMVTPSLILEEKVANTEESKKDASTMVSPSLSFERKASKLDDAKKVLVEKSTNAPTASFEGRASKLADPKKTEIAKTDAATMITPSSSFHKKPEETDDLKKIEAGKTTVKPNLDFEDTTPKEVDNKEGGIKKADANTMVTASLIFERDDSKKSILKNVKVEKTDAATLVTPSLSYDQAKIKEENDAGKTTRKESYSQTDEPLDLSKAARNEKKEIEAMERALNIKSESTKSYDATQDEKKPLALPTTTGKPPVGKTDAATQFTAADIAKAGLSPRATTAARALEKRDQGNQTAPWRFDYDYDSSEKILSATGQPGSSQKGAKPPYSKTGTQGTQTDCDCYEERSVSETKVKQSVSHRTGLNVVKRNIATQTEFCTCNYEESSLSSYTSTEDCFGRK